MRHERLPYALFAVSRKMAEQLVGRLFAGFLGWKDGYIGPGARVMGSRHISVGERAYINRYAWIEAVHTFRAQSFAPVIQIGRGFSASDRLHISAVNRIEIGDDCLFGSGIYISDHNHGSYKGTEHSDPAHPPVDRELLSLGPVTIGSNVWLGDNVIIIGPLSIGDGAVIGANSVVLQNIPMNTIAAGSPAKKIKHFNRTSQRWEEKINLL